MNGRLVAHRLRNRLSQLVSKGKNTFTAIAKFLELAFHLIQKLVKVKLPESRNVIKLVMKQLNESSNLQRKYSV